MPTIKNYPVFFMNVDSPKRDLEWRLMMAVKLAKKGGVSVVGQKEYTFPVHGQSENAIWFGRFAANDSISPLDNKLFDAFKKKKTSIYFLHDEGGFYTKEVFSNTVLRIHPPSVLKLGFVDKVFLWGGRQYDIISENCPEIIDKLRISGYPRFDLYNYSKQGEVNKKKVLFCSKFTSSNPGRYSLPIFSDRNIELNSKVVSPHEVRDFIYSRWKKNSLEMMAFCDLAKEVAASGKKIIFRPHPDEGIDFYRQVFHDFKNIKVSAEGDLSKEIASANVVVQSGCTSGLEALVAGVPVINYQPCYGSSMSVEGLSEIGYVVKSHEEAFEKVMSPDDKGSEFKELESDILSRLGKSSDFIIREMEESGAFKKASSLSFPDPKTFPQSKEMPEGKEFSYNREMLFDMLKKYSLANNASIRVLSSGYNHIIVAPAHK